MMEQNLWTTFAKTGCIEDYLAYKGVGVDAKVGEEKLESKNKSDRDGFVSDADR